MLSYGELIRQAVSVFSFDNNGQYFAYFYNPYMSTYFLEGGLA
jgi:hypothetical protein